MSEETHAPYDSRVDTLIHSQRVGELMVQIVHEALDRSTCHDLSKTLPPEVEVFDVVSPRLKTLTYGSDEYKASLAEMGDALAHHYANNSHHPEHHPDGVNGMTLVDLVEMLSDWKAATERHADGDLVKSLQIQQGRFSMTWQLTQILSNTAAHFGWIPGRDRHVEPRLKDADLKAINDRAVTAGQAEIEGWGQTELLKAFDASQRDVAPLLAEVEELRARVKASS